MKKAPLLSGFFLLFLSIASIAQRPHDRAFWQSIGKNNYVIPEHESPDLLANELSALLASPDPELRDDLAYSILAHWIYRPDVLQQSTLIALTDQWRANLKDGLGEAGTTSVLKRSFSALCLASIVRREARTPFLGAVRYHQLVREAITYIQTERDLRGYDAKLHWIHAAAHTADLLSGLAASPQLTHEESDAILSAISTRLATAPDVFTQGEQDRLAAAVLAVVRRPEFDAGKFEQWLTAMENEDRDVWTATTPERLAEYQNHTYLLQALFTRLAVEPDSSRNAEYKQKLLTVMKTRMD